MGRYIVWSLVFHVAALGGGAILAPLGGIFGSTYKPTQIISVGLVDFAEPPRAAPVAVPRPTVPTPASDAAIALQPERDLTPEQVPDEPEPEAEPEPEPEKDQQDATEQQAGDGEDSTAQSQLAQSDTATGVSHSITETGGDDIWGVETPANVNPYHRRGFTQIRNNWRNPVVGPTGRKCVVRFRVLRSGEIVDIELEQSSGVEIFDQAALRAVQYAKSWDSFPAFWEEDEQIIHLEFEYRPK